MNPRSSLRGARPKTSVLDPNNHLWISKSPSRKDKGNIGAWEMVTYELATTAGINMAERQAQKSSSDCHTFLTKRFDRTAIGKRLHFRSAITQLRYTDGADAATGASYLELVEFIISHGAKITADLEELWRRIVFSVCVSNTSNHLRNHGFILTKEGWTLSPAFDINSVESGTGLKLNISEDDYALDLDLAMEVHEYFRLDEERDSAIIEKVKNTVRQLPEIANKYGFSRAERELKAPAFNEAMR